MISAMHMHTCIHNVCRFRKTRQKQQHPREFNNVHIHQGTPIKHKIKDIQLHIFLAFMIYLGTNSKLF